MKTSTLKWVNVIGLILLAAALVLLLLSHIMSTQTLFVSVGWHDLASVDWVSYHSI